jgi:hypothetical protein
MLECMRTTLTLDDEVAALLSAAVANNDASLKSVVNDALRRGLLQMAQQPVVNQQFRTRTYNGGGCLFPNLDNTQEILAIVEGESYR